jgi:hypothetical protein
VVTSKIPVLICIDVEPDEFFVSRRNPQPWRGYELTHAYISSLRSALQELTGDAVHVSWFIRMDPQVALAHGRAAWAVEHYGALFDDAIAAGDELGTHVHTYRWCENSGDWLDDHGHDDWVAECLETAVDGYRASFGTTCRSLRFGNYWLGTEAINRAEALGFRFDLTIEPGLPPNALDSRKPPHSGDLPDYYRVPREPYAPSRRDFRRKARTGERAITLLPLTSAHVRFGWGPRSLKQRLRRLRHNGFRHRLQDTPLSMWRDWSHPNDFSLMLDRAIAQQRHPYLAFAINSNAPVETMSLPRIKRCLQALMVHPERPRFVFCTPAEAMAILRGNASGHGSGAPSG